MGEAPVTHDGKQVPRATQSAASRNQRLVLVAVAAVGLMTYSVAPRAARAESWTRHYINSLPDAAFASVETAPDGTKVRHLPHHDRDGHVDLSHVRNALSRLSQVKWIDPENGIAAHQHLTAHLREAHENHGGIK